MVIVNAVFSFSGKKVEQTRCYLNFINNREYIQIIEKLIEYKDDNDASRCLILQNRSLLNEFFSNLEALEMILRFSFLEKNMKAYYREMSANYAICVLVNGADYQLGTLRRVRHKLIKERKKLVKKGLSKL